MTLLRPQCNGDGAQERHNGIPASSRQEESEYEAIVAEIWQNLELYREEF